MTWRVEATPAAGKQIAAPAPEIRARIRRALDEKLIPDPKAHVIPLMGPLRGHAKFRVGDRRLICRRDDGVLLVLVVKVDHRRGVDR